MNKTTAKTDKNEEHRIWYEGDAGEMWDFYKNRDLGGYAKELTIKIKKKGDK